MGSRSLLRRTSFLVAWVVGILVLLNLREPGFWREVVGAGPTPTPPAAAAPAPSGASAAASASATAGAHGATTGGPVATPTGEDAAIAAAETASAPAGPAPTPAVARAPALTAVGGPSRTARAARAGGTASRRGTAHGPGDRPLYERKSEAWRLATAHRYAEAWAIARRLPDRRDDLDLVRLRASTATWAGASEAEALGRAWVARDPGSVEAELVLAQAELQAGDTAGARSGLDALATRGDLDPEQRLRLARLQEWAHDPAGAAASYRAVLAARPDDLDASIALARVLESSHHAEQALEAIVRARALDPGNVELSLLEARSAAALGDRRRATGLYERVLAARPADPDLELEAARYFVNAGEAKRAIVLYREAIAARGPEGLRVELARALLAAGEYAEAEAVAGAAVASPEDGPEARLALAQSVYLQGRLRESGDLFAAARDSGAQAGLGAVWTARVALAEDRHLGAYDLLGDELDAYDARATASRSDGDGDEGKAGAAGPAPGQGSAAAVALDRGSAAEKRGDLGRARDAYERAVALGARLGASLALDRLDARTRPFLEGAYVHFSDANDIDIDGGLVRGEAWVGGDRARLVAQAIAQVVAQRDVRYTRTGGAVGFRDLFLTPATSLAANVGFVNSSAGGGDLVTADLDLRHFFADTSVLGLAGYRESLLAGHEDLDPRLFNRIIDLEAVTPSFAINGGRLYLDQALRTAARDRLWLSAGAENYEDGNLRGTFYGHYQLPLRQLPGEWLVVRPNAFVEAFKRSDVPAYFSPSSHATIGLAAHTVLEKGAWRLEGELNPQMLVTNGDPGYGAYALLDASVDLGEATVGVSGFGFYDSHDDYWLARAMARVVVPF